MDLRQEGKEMETKKRLRELCRDAAISCGMPSVDMPLIADYLARNGVIVPPCKVGDKVYQTDEIRIYESTVMEVTYTTNKVVYCTENICFDETAIGRSIFLTKEEAEKALEEKEGDTQ